MDNLNLPSRRVELPMAFEDRWTRADIERYVKYTRQDAPNVIDGHNIEYIARYNGLKGAEEVIQYLCATEWWNACIGFWPGLPFMFPLDPRYAIVTPKYNPTRPWTPEGAVGIGGPCVAIYPVASPGGYQLFGRTIPIFDLQQRNPAFRDNPILLKPADRIRWVRVTDEEVTFTWKDYAANCQRRELTLSGVEFLRRFGGHVWSLAMARMGARAARISYGARGKSCAAS